MSSCLMCGKTFGRRDSYIRHIRLMHPDVDCQQFRKNRSNVICPTCDQNQISYCALIEHVEWEHQIKIDYEELEFMNAEDFNTWLEGEEQRDQCKFISSRSERKLSNQTTKITKLCNRSGVYKPSIPPEERRRLTKKSLKMGATCPAHLVKEERDQKIFVKYYKTHLGHGPDPGRMQLTKDEKSLIARKLQQGIPADRILTDVTTTNENGVLPSRLQLIDSQDLRNIAKKFKIDYLPYRLKRRKVNGKNTKMDESVKALQDRRRLINIYRGKATKQSTDMWKRHKGGIELKAAVVQNSELEWIVPSQANAEDFIKITPTEHFKNCTALCELLCQHCGVCYKALRCPCVDYSVKKKLCRHIHATVLRLNSEGLRLDSSAVECQLANDNNLEKIVGYRREECDVNRKNENNEESFMDSSLVASEIEIPLDDKLCVDSLRVECDATQDTAVDKFLSDRSNKFTVKRKKEKKKEPFTDSSLVVSEVEMPSISRSEEFIVNPINYLFLDRSEVACQLTNVTEIEKRLDNHSHIVKREGEDEEIFRICSPVDDEVPQTYRNKKSIVRRVKYYSVGENSPVVESQSMNDIEQPLTCRRKKPSVMKEETECEVLYMDDTLDCEVSIENEVYSSEGLRLDNSAVVCQLLKDNEVINRGEKSTVERGCKDKAQFMENLPVANEVEISSMSPGVTCVVKVEQDMSEDEEFCMDSSPMENDGRMHPSLVPSEKCIVNKVTYLPEEKQHSMDSPLDKESPHCYSNEKCIVKRISYSSKDKKEISKDRLPVSKNTKYVMSSTTESQERITSNSLPVDNEVELPLLAFREKSGVSRDNLLRLINTLTGMVPELSEEEITNTYRSIECVVGRLRLKKVASVLSCRGYHK